MRSGYSKVTWQRRWRCPTTAGQTCVCERCEQIKFSNSMQCIVLYCIVFSCNLLPDHPGPTGCCHKFNQTLQVTCPWTVCKRLPRYRPLTRQPRPSFSHLQHTKRVKRLPAGATLPTRHLRVLVMPARPDTDETVRRLLKTALFRPAALPTTLGTGVALHGSRFTGHCAKVRGSVIGLGYITHAEHVCTEWRS